jgi:hypothetical protein
MLPAVRYRQHLAASDDVRTEGTAERQRLRQVRPLGALVPALAELAVVGDERDERDRHADQSGGEPRDAVEHLLGRRVQQPGLGERGEAFGILYARSVRVRHVPFRCESAARLIRAHPAEIWLRGGRRTMALFPTPFAAPAPVQGWR